MEVREKMTAIDAKRLIKSVVVNATITGVGYFGGLYIIMNYLL